MTASEDLTGEGQVGGAGRGVRRGGKGSVSHSAEPGPERYIDPSRRPTDQGRGIRTSRQREVRGVCVCVLPCGLLRDTTNLQEISRILEVVEAPRIAGIVRSCCGCDDDES